jgi:anti-sigma-K factor RskA
MSARPVNPAGNDGILAAEYALGLLRGSVRDAFARRVQSDPALAATVRQWDEQFSNFADDIAEVEAPSSIEAALDKRLFGDAAKAPLWYSLNFWRGLAIASLVTAVSLGLWTLQRPVEKDSPALVAQVAGEAKAVTLVAYYDTAKGELRLNRTTGEAAAGRVFQLWLIAGQDAPVSLGVLPADAATRITVPAALRAKFTGGVLAVSDEPTGGSPTGQPTGAVLATGQLSVI